MVKEINEKYRCNVCGNEVMVTKVGGGTLVCCGEEMELISGGKKKSMLEEGFEVENEEENEGEPKEIEDYKEDMEEIEEEETV